MPARQATRPTTRKARRKLQLAIALGLLAALAVGWDAWRQHHPNLAPASPQHPAQKPQLPALKPPNPPTSAILGALPPELQNTLAASGATYGVVHLWATWCPPCMAEMPNLLKALPNLPPQVALVMLSLDDPPPQRFYQSQGIARTTPQVNWQDDPSRTLANMLIQNVKLPTTLIYRLASPTAPIQQIDGPLLWPPLLKVLGDV